MVLVAQRQKAKKIGMQVQGAQLFAACTTHAQRLLFLKGLLTHDDYKVACQMLKGSLSFNDINGLPVWASWSSGDANLPNSFFDGGGLELAITDIRTVTSSVNAMEPVVVLAFGLASCGLATAHESNLRSDIPMDAEGRILQIVGRVV